jgi:hypothetical protein
MQTMAQAFLLSEQLNKNFAAHSQLIIQFLGKIKLIVRLQKLN